jgi:SAM-dependent methyltransferase
VADVGAGYGLLLEEWRREFPAAHLLGLEPNPYLARVCRAKGFRVVENFVEEAAGMEGQVDLTLALEVLEHVYDPLEFCLSLKHLLRAGGRMLLTGLTVDGFDIQVLWEHSKSVSPPHHINFMSVRGLEALLSRAGFRQTRIFTPGKLDVDIVRNAVRETPGLLSGQRFIQHLLSLDENRVQNFQTFLSQHHLSSHVWVWAVK